ncbi:MAG: hypothetical protein KDC87_14450, partial [Planctomycetes bacterium]|nr:hypothetical protein [Planctomycetota bacterium]
MGVESVVRRGWTRLLGLGLVIVASSYAFDSNWPVPLGDRRLATPRSAAPVGALRVERAPGGACAFTWIRGVPSGPWRLVLLDAQRRELAWSPPLEGG